jgi:hypothetical protein
MMGDDATGRAIATLGPRRLAEAITSPASLLGAGAVGGLAVAVAGPIGLVAGAVAWLGLTLFRLRPKTVAQRARAERDRIDPFTLPQAWRGPVQSALETQRRFDAAVRSTSPGPVRDQLENLRDEVASAVDGCWETSKRGAQLQRAYEQLDPASTAAELDEAQHRLSVNTDPARQPTLAATVSSLQTQLDAAERLRNGAITAQDRLRSLDAQLDEIVARTVELSATADDVGAVDALGADLDRVRMEMEAVRQGLDEAGRIERATFGTTSSA